MCRLIGIKENVRSSCAVLSPVFCEAKDGICFAWAVLASGSLVDPRICRGRQKKAYYKKPISFHEPPLLRAKAHTRRTRAPEKEPLRRKTPSHPEGVRYPLRRTRVPRHLIEHHNKSRSTLRDGAQAYLADRALNDAATAAAAAAATAAAATAAAAVLAACPAGNTRSRSLLAAPSPS